MSRHREPGMSDAPWRNWSGTVEARPARRVLPVTTDDVTRAVEDAGRAGVRVKAVGSGHSFTGVCFTDGVQLDLRRLSGIIESDVSAGRVRVWAGTTLAQLNRALDGLGLAMTNLGDIDAQTVAGAIGTGTHGTGAAYGGLATQVTGLRLVLADGAVVWCSGTERPELFAAARLGLGAFGVVTEVELACVPAFRVRAVERPERLSALVSRLDEVMTAHDHVEFFWFPHTDQAMLKSQDRLALGDTSGEPLPMWQRVLSDDVVDNRLFGALNRAIGLRRAWTPKVNQVSARTMSRRDYTDVSHRVFVSPRTVRFRESEYAVPRSAVAEILLFLQEWFARTGEPVTFPLEVRYAAADDIPLSTAFGRDSAYIALHQYVGHDHTRAFRVFEDVMADHEGRPHWGKMHRLGVAELSRLYPRFGEVLAVRDAVDPQRRFANPYLDRVFGS